jgi:hypothetical protein
MWKAAGASYVLTAAATSTAESLCTTPPDKSVRRVWWLRSCTRLWVKVWECTFLKYDLQGIPAGRDSSALLDAEWCMPVG